VVAVIEVFTVRTLPAVVVVAPLASRKVNGLAVVTPVTSVDQALGGDPDGHDHEAELLSLVLVYSARWSAPPVSL
jgi:hypothetical protein